MSLLDFVFPDDIDKAKELLEINKMPEARPFRFRLRSMNGTEVWAEIQAATARAPSGDVCGVTAMVTATDLGSQAFLDRPQTTEHN